MIRLIALDMDGTLLTPPPVHITKTSIRALKEAASRGIRLVIASGRLTDDASRFAADAGLDTAVIALNGSCMALHPFGELMHVHHFDLPLGRSILEMLLQSNLFFGMFCDHDLYIHDRDPENPTPDSVWGTHLTDTRGTISRDLTQGMRLAERGISKFVLIDRECSGILTQLSDRLVQLEPGLSLSSSWTDNLEINPPGVSKGSALRDLCAMLDIPLDQVMAVGDNRNDLPMLQLAGFPVAMGNASPEALQAAAYQTRTNAQDGVAAAVSVLALGENTKGVIRLEVPY